MAAEPPPPQPPPGPAPRRLPHPLLWRWRRNPLRRPADLAQGWVALGLVLAVLTAAPVAVFAAGDTAYRHYRATAAHQERTGEHVPAVLVHAAPRHPEPGSDEARETRYPVDVRFTAPDGTGRTGRTHVEPGLPAESTVLVWVDAEGRITDPPLSAAEIRSRTMGWAVLAFLAVVLTGAAAYGLAARWLHRRNLAAWSTAWTTTAPRWSPSP
ncbi:hypothetical protein [Streptomyces sp. SID8352]|uniref:Rv1733c family protein n=1 Tax=Streptomyces sp. SID8352 TaxID=2690338 RepID=UPI001369A0F4|nr:hypothetical protein [Streptomyces sp. SID8352]